MGEIRTSTVLSPKVAKSSATTASPSPAVKVAEPAANFAAGPGAPSTTRAGEGLTRSPESANSDPKASKEVLTTQGQVATRVAGPAAKPPDPASTRKSSNELYRAMHGGLGWGTDEEGLFAALQGKSPAEVEAIRSEYKDHYGRDLDKDVRGELSGGDARRADAMLRGDVAAGDADRLASAMKGLGTDEAAITETLKGKTPEQLQAISEQYQSRHGVSLEKALGSDLSGRDLDKARSLLKGDGAGSDVADLRAAMEGLGTNEAGVHSTLKGKSPEQLEAIGQKYQEQTGRTLEADLRGDLSGTDLTRALAAAGGDSAGADAAELRQAMDGLGTDEKAIHGVLEGKSPEQRQALAESYRQQTGGDLGKAFSSEMSGNDLGKTEALLQNGKLSGAQQVHFATAGLGTNESDLLGALEGKSKEEIATIRQEYKERFGADLDETVRGELSGRDGFEADLALRGKPTSGKEALEVSNERYAFEREGAWNAVSGGVIDLFSSHGEMLDRNHQRANAHAQENQGNTSAESEARLTQLAGFSDDDVGVYREAKDSVAEGAATTAATVASVAVAVGTMGTGTPLSAAMLASAGAGAVARTGTKAVIQGQGYSGGDALTDLAIGGAEGVTSVIGGGVGKAVGKGLLAREAAGTLAGWEVNGTARLTNMVGREALEGSAAKSALYARTANAADGAVSGALSGTTQTALTDDTWEQGFETGLARVAGGGGIGLLTGTTVGAAMPTFGRSAGIVDELTTPAEPSLAAQHMLEPGKIGSRSKGVNAGHRQATLEKALEGQGEIRSRTPVAGLPGVEVVEYSLYQGTAQGGVSDQLQTRAWPKTVFDETLWPQSRIDGVGDTAFQGLSDGTHEVPYMGVTLQGWVREGNLQSYGVK